MRDTNPLAKLITDRNYGAGGGTRTRTSFSPMVFETTASTIPPPRRMKVQDTRYRFKLHPLSMGILTSTWRFLATNILLSWFYLELIVEIRIMQKVLATDRYRSIHVGCD